ncbi:glycoside hydrolase [Thermoanaerobacterium thermosaccharolyticum]|uniref:Glycoside hydrolase n=1 Tax=Thermoanaerobacterium thermosaccharolyticum TaxID=1517 RepID=A0A231VJZ1_THETR|nr:glycoside hydrolase family 43 protein [Thermoanaerobacterium thermosaccharolyticum]OXT08439.1 glycoside hydrolase [Thermoanaerobacterium thermosaccharolyticum]
MIKRKDLYIRDPFVVPVLNEKVYYMFGTTDINCWNDEKATGFDYYKSSDLENFEGPFIAFRPDKNFIWDKNFWAPEVHKYNDMYYMFATFFAKGRNRGTQILVSEKISGPYRPWSIEPVTPKDWMCLDGTFYVDEKGEPWIIFCHEWVQIYDGEICAVRLSKDLKTTIGNPITLFKASSANWTRSIKTINNHECYVTDGPFVYRSDEGKLYMLWSSFIENNIYAVGVSLSKTGKITGPWVHSENPIFAGDGGHGMIFKTFEGNLILALHTPNKRKEERPLFITLQKSVLNDTL